jgi:acyl-CoA synthetase (AMP-forming)/AMP-acid ligase II
VLGSGEHLVPGRLAAELADRLASFKRPRRIAVLDALPLTASGKPDRAEVARRATPKLEPL